MVCRCIQFPLTICIVFFATFCQDKAEAALRKARAAYYGNATSNGACGYGDFGTTMNNGSVAAVGSLYGNGKGCGACYQIACTNLQFCNGNAILVTVTDSGSGGDGVEFILSTQAYSKFALPNRTDDLFSVGVLDVQYERVPCPIRKNIDIQIKKSSTFPYYLSFQLLDVGGASDILDIQLCSSNRSSPPQNCTGVRRGFGSVWDVSPAPDNDMFVSLLLATNSNGSVSGNTGAIWRILRKPIPVQWTPGAVYDSESQIPDELS